MSNNPSKSWKITDFDISEKRKQFYKDLDKTRMALGCEVCPETKKEHLQIFITFKRNYRFKGMKKLIGDAHIEIAKVDDWNYELKEMNYIIDDRRTPGQRKDIEIAKKATKIADIVDEVGIQAIRYCELRLKYKEAKRDWKPKVFWYYGASDTGKSWWPRQWHKGEDLFEPLDWNHWEGYDGHETIIIDDFRAQDWPFNQLLKILGEYAYRVNCKYGSRQLLAKRIYITTPKSIKETYNWINEELYQLERRVDVEFQCLNKYDCPPIDSPEISVPVPVPEVR